MSSAPASNAAENAAPRARTVPSPRAALRGLTSALPALAVICALAVAYALLFPGFLNYDSFYSLAWAEGITRGHAPDFATPFAPTPHPLQLGLALVAVQFGDTAQDLFLALSFLSLGFFVWITYKLAKEWFGAAVGLLAAVIVATRDQIIALAVHGRVDLPFAALVLAAALVVSRRPRAGWPVLLLLSLAGMLRPEAWALALLYWLWIFPRRGALERAGLLLLAISAPLVWGATDLAVTGDALHSFTGTADLADRLEHRRSLADLPYSLPVGLAYFAREPVMVGALVGFAFALVRRRDQVAMPIVLMVAAFATFAGLAVAGLPLIARYLLFAVAVLCILCALAVLGWRKLEPGRSRRRWEVAAAVVAALLIAFVPVMLVRLLEVRWEAVQRGAFQDDLQRLASSPSAQRYFDEPACRPVFTQNHRQVPFLRTWLDLGPKQVINGVVERPDRGSMVRAVDPDAQVGYVRRLNDKAAYDTPRPRDFRLVALNPTWGLYASPACRAAVGEPAAP